MAIKSCIYFLNCFEISLPAGMAIKSCIYFFKLFRNIVSSLNGYKNLCFNCQGKLWKIFISWDDYKSLYILFKWLVNLVVNKDSYIRVIRIVLIDIKYFYK